MNCGLKKNGDKYERGYVKEQCRQQKGQLAQGSKVNTIRVYTFLWISEKVSLVTMDGSEGWSNKEN